MLRTRIVAGATSGFVMSAVFATVLTVAHFGDAFVEPWRVDPAQAAPITLRLPRTTVKVADPDSGNASYQTLTAMVPRGHAVREEPLATMVRIYERERRPPRPTQLAAQWLVYFLFVLLGTTFMRQGTSQRAGLMRVQVSLLGLSALLLVGGKVGLLFTDLPAYLMPVALVPLWASLYVDRRTGLMLSLVITLCASSLVSYDPVVTAVYLLSTTTSTLSFQGRPRASTLVPAGLGGGLIGAVVYIAAREIYDGFDLTAEIGQALRSGPASALLAGLGAGIVGLILHAPVSRLLGIVSRGQLLNLSDLEQPLLQKMATEAPGSWEHSRMMANLAEAAAASIHADALLTRVGAYYHDLGKSVQPHYFVENLQPGETSPHEELDPEVSADAIMAHVVEGVRILREGSVPEAVIEFAYTHHGTSVIEFFWHKCKKAGNVKGLMEDAFRYPGMRPRSKETGILMLIDAIEAGARTVNPPAREKFDELVRRVIFSKLKQGQLDESGLSLAELRIVTLRIVDTLCSAYHSRIKYPWQEQDTDAAGKESKDTSTSDQTSTGKHSVVRKPEVGEQGATTPAAGIRASAPTDAKDASAKPSAGTRSERRDEATRLATAHDTPSGPGEDKVAAGDQRVRSGTSSGPPERQRRGSDPPPKPEAGEPPAERPTVATATGNIEPSSTKEPQGEPIDGDQPAKTPKDRPTDGAPNQARRSASSGSS